MTIKHITYLILFSLVLISCGTTKRNVPEEKMNRRNGVEITDPLMVKISKNAKEFLGTRYKYGGTTKKGMDCSGLIYTSFQKENIPIPRTSRGMSLLGERLFLKEVGIGDLLFFETNKNRKVINHVGLVINTAPNDIFFIHSTTSRGVIISSLNQEYWQSHFVMARRIK